MKYRKRLHRPSGDFYHRHSYYAVAQAIQRHITAEGQALKLAAFHNRTDPEDINIPYLLTKGSLPFADFRV